MLNLQRTLSQHRNHLWSSKLSMNPPLNRRALPRLVLPMKKPKLSRYPQRINRSSTNLLAWASVTVPHRRSVMHQLAWPGATVPHQRSVLLPSPTLSGDADKPLTHPVDTRHHYNPIDTPPRLIDNTVEHVAASIIETWMAQSNDCIRDSHKECRTQWNAPMSFSYLAQPCSVDSPLYLFGPKFIRRATIQATGLHELSAPPSGRPTRAATFEKVMIPASNIHASESVNYIMRRNGRVEKLAEYISYGRQKEFEYSLRGRFCSPDTRVEDFATDAVRKTPILFFSTRSGFIRESYLSRTM